MTRTNGSAEITYRILIKALKAGMSELALPDDCWRSAMQLVMTYVNNRPNEKLDGLTPNEIYSARGKDGRISHHDVDQMGKHFAKN